MQISQTTHGLGHRTLQKVLLEIREVVLPDDVRTRVGTEHLPEDLKHRGWTLPSRRHHVIRNLENKVKRNQILWLQDASKSRNSNLGKVRVSSTNDVRFLS